MAAGGCGGEDSDTDGTVEVSWSSPGRDSEVFGIARLKVSASSDEGISEVSFYCDSVDDAHLIGTVSSPTDSACTQVWYTTTVPNGEHTLYAVALDEQDAVRPGIRTVTVGNLTRAEALAEAVTWRSGPPRWTLTIPS